MRRARSAATLSVLVALAFASTDASSGRAKPSSRADAGSVWVGTITVSYVDSEKKQQTATTFSSIEIKTELTIKSFQDGTARAHASYRRSELYSGITCDVPDQTTVSEDGGFIGPVATPGVFRAGNRYHVSYASPGITTLTVRIRDFGGNAQQHCDPDHTQTAERGVRSAQITEIGGLAAGELRLVHGTFSETIDRCPGTGDVCRERTTATWHLRRMSRVKRGRGRGRGRGPGGGGGGGPGPGGSGGGGRPGSGCSNVETGTSGPDEMIGTNAGDRLRGLAGDDRIDGLADNDCLEGGPGKDMLLGRAGNDLIVGGADVDSFVAGAGNDRILARDGTAETIRCGPGRDIVAADDVDQLVGCERRS